jgi:hypothetical protein
MLQSSDDWFYFNFTTPPLIGNYNFNGIQNFTLKFLVPVNATKVKVSWFAASGQSDHNAYFPVKLYNDLNVHWIWYHPDISLSFSWASGEYDFDFNITDLNKNIYIIGDS